MTDIERDHEFDSDDERPVDGDGIVEPENPIEADELETLDVHRDPEAPEADVIEQHLEVPLDDEPDV